MTRSAFLLSTAFLVAFTGAAAAQSVQVIGTFKDWAAYSASEGAGAV